MNGSRTMLTLTAAVALVAGAAGCTAVDRAGGTADRPVHTLTFANGIDGAPPAQVQAWAEQVEDASDGSLSIEFANGWRYGEAHAERGLIGDVEDGEVDLAWVGARAFDRIGVTTFQALLAPMLVDSHELQRAVFEDGIPDEMLTGVEDVGVVPVGVLPGPMRKVLGLEKPFREPGDFRGAVVGMGDSELTETALAALGATPKAFAGGPQLHGLHAYEQQLSSIAGNNYETQARYVTANLDLWPRPLVLIANAETFSGLSDGHQQALAQAGQKAVLPALDASRAEDDDGADELCRRGMELVQATDDQLDALRTAWQPLYDDLATEPDTAAWLDRIQALKSSIGAEPDGARCSSVGTPGGADDSRAQDELTGTWTTELTDADWAEAGIDGLAGTYTLEFADGRVTVKDPPDGQIGYRARYSAFRGRLVTSESVDVLHAAYRIDGDKLYLSDVTVEGFDEAGPYGVVWSTRPLTRSSG